jgi:hypothetical protein
MNETFATLFFAPFFGFLLGQVVSPIVSSVIQRIERKRAAQWDYDETLALEAFSVLMPKTLGKITDDIYGGRVTLARLHKLDRFIDLQARWAFAHKGVNSKFSACADAVKRLRKFTQGTFHIMADGIHVRFERPVEINGGDEKYTRLLREREELVREVDSKFDDYRREVGRHVPNVLTTIIQREKNRQAGSQRRECSPPTEGRQSSQAVEPI